MNKKKIKFVNEYADMMLKALDYIDIDELLGIVETNKFLLMDRVIKNSDKIED